MAGIYKAHLKKGFVITSDYGFNNILDRFASNDRAVWNFAQKDILEELGIDMTSEVDFETMKLFGQELGFTTEYAGKFEDYLSLFSTVIAVISQWVLVQSIDMPVPGPETIANGNPTLQSG
jgi:hypothetical protein